MHRRINFASRKFYFRISIHKFFSEHKCTMGVLTTMRTAVYSIALLVAIHIQLNHILVDLHSGPEKTRNDTK